MDDPAMFLRPIRISADEVGSIITVESLKDASNTLVDWPHARRGPFYQAARERVEAALKGDIGTEEAAEAFLALCQHAGLVVAD